MSSGRPGSGPTGFGRRSVKQVTFRVDRLEVDEFYRMLAEEGMSLQDFLTMCVRRYMASDPRMRGLIEQQRRDREVSSQERDTGRVFDADERERIMDEIERTGRKI